MPEDSLTDGYWAAKTAAAAAWGCADKAYVPAVNAYHATLDAMAAYQEGV